MRVYHGISNEIATLYESLGNHGEETYVMQRVKGAARNVVQFLEKRLYRDQELNLNILSLAKGLVTIEDEAKQIKCISIILAGCGGAASSLEMLPDLTTASDRLRGVNTGRSKCHPFQ